MATFPVLKVEVAFVSNPLDIAPSWTDVTQYVRHVNGVDIQRGRSDPWSHFTAGRLTLTFSNRDRRFDSLYSAGPYFGNLKPGKQIRVTCTWSAVTYDLFRGFVGTWPQEFSNAGKDATVTVECYDGLEWAAAANLSSDPYSDYLNAIGTPAIWLRQADSTSWADAQGLASPSLANGPISTSSSLAAGLKSNPVQFNAVSYFDIGTVPSGTGTWTIGFWIKTTATSGTILRYYAIETFPLTLPASETLVEISSGKIHCLIVLNNNLTFKTQEVTSTINIADGALHFVAIVGQTATGPTVYVDGIADTAATSTGGGNVQPRIFRVGAHGLPSTIALAPLTAATQLQDVFMITATMSATNVSVLYQLGLGYATEDTATRFGRYLNDTGWPASWRDVTTTPAGTVNTLVYNNQQLITSLQELESSEQGRIFVSKSGNFTLHARYFNQDITRGNTSQATFTDDGTAFTYRDFGYTQDDTDVRNDVTVTNTVGSSRSSDSASITANRRRSETVNTILSTVDQRQAMAAGLVVQWKDAAVRVKQFTVGIPSNWATFLNLEIGDRITVKQTPMGVGTQFSKDLIIDSISWRITADFWEMRIAAAPVTPNGLNWFVLDTSALDGADVLGY
jgi:hypothetical protein